MNISFKDIGNRIVNFFKKCGVGFYLLLAAAIISLVMAILYYCNFIVTQNYGDIRVFIAMMVAIPAILLYFFKYTSRYSAVVMYVIFLIAFILFIDSSYMLLSTKFFNGIDPNMNILEQASYEWSFTVIMLVINLLLTGTAIFFERKYVKNNENKKEIK